jgi:hypothetical protein
VTLCENLFGDGKGVLNNNCIFFVFFSVFLCVLCGSTVFLLGWWGYSGWAW